MDARQRAREPGLASYVEGLRGRIQAEARQAEEHRRAVRERLPEAIHLLVGEFGATRIVLFGSLARGEALPESDVDLLVDGIPPARFFEAQAAMDRVLTPTRVDLVPRERARPMVLQRAEAEGEVLHG